MFSEQTLLESKKYAIHYFKNSKNPLSLSYYRHVDDDRDVVLEAVKRNGLNLKYASDELKNDKEIVLIAVQQCGIMLDYVSHQLQNDKEVVLTAVKQDGTALEFASTVLKKDREIAITAIKNDSYSYKYVHRTLKRDRELYLLFRGIFNVQKEGIDKLTNIQFYFK